MKSDPKCTTSPFSTDPRKTLLRKIWYMILRYFLVTSNNTKFYLGGANTTWKQSLYKPYGTNSRQIAAHIVRMNNGQTSSSVFLRILLLKTLRFTRQVNPCITIWWRRLSSSKSKFPYSPDSNSIMNCLQLIGRLSESMLILISIRRNVSKFILAFSSIKFTCTFTQARENDDEE